MAVVLSSQSSSPSSPFRLENGGCGAVTTSSSSGSSSSSPRQQRSKLTAAGDADGSELVNVFLRMWDGKTLCCTIDPSNAGAINFGLLENRVLANYPEYNKNDDFYFVSQGKPINETNFEYVVNWNKDGGTITVFVQYRNKGGCYVVSFTIFCIIMTAIVGSACTCGASLIIVPILLPLLFVLPLFCL